MTLGELRVHRVVSPARTPRIHADNPPLVCVLLHGFGAPGDDLVGLANALAPASRETIFLFPEALLPPRGRADFGGARAWWMIDIARLQRAQELGRERDLSEEVPDGLAAARTAVIEMLDRVSLELPEHRLVLGGFSQGSMLALDVALRDPRPLAGLVLLSSTIIAQQEWWPRLTERKHLPVFQSHGTGDPILSHAIATRLHEALAAAGLDATFDSFAGGHTIPAQTLARLGGWLEDLRPHAA